MIKGLKLSLIVPCRNEEKAIVSVLKSVPEEIDEVLVIDNLSIDNTTKIAKSLGAKVFKETRTDNGIGYGYALAKGISLATGDIVACLDGDGSYPVRKIPKIVRYLLKKNLDFISCNRVCHDSIFKRSQVRSFGVLVLNIFIWLLYGYKIKDSLSGMWIFKKEITPKLLLFEGGWNFSEEIKLSAIINSGINFKEHPIPFHDRIFNQSKLQVFSAGFNYFIYLFKRRLMEWRISGVDSTQTSLLEVVNY